METITDDFPKEVSSYDLLIGAVNEKKLAKKQRRLDKKLKQKERDKKKLWSLSSLFKKDEKKLAQERSKYTLKELKINILVANYTGDKALNNLTKPAIYLAVPSHTTIIELKQRVFGATKIPSERIMLFFCGKLLSDYEIQPTKRKQGKKVIYQEGKEATIPMEAFESNDRLTEDEELYRPRMFLGLRPGDDDSDSDWSSDEEAVIDEATLAANQEQFEIDELKRIEQEKMELKVMEKMKLAEEIEVKKFQLQKNSFKLEEDLDKIGCKYYYKKIRKAGYEDEGAFGNITDADLAKLFIPNKSRIQILALADIVRRKYTMLTKNTTAQAEIEKKILASGGVHVIPGGDPAGFTKKIDLKRAWEKKDALDKEAARLALEVKNRKPGWDIVKKKHSKELESKIEKIRWRCEVDEFGIPKNWDQPRVEKWCCRKHQKESISLREKFIAGKKATNINDLKSTLNRIDILKNGFISRNMLRVVAQQQLIANRHIYPDDLLENFLDTCLMSTKDQVASGEWCSEIERRETLAGIPVVRYDSHIFWSSFINILESLDRKRYF